jgi:quinoprotein glucose dehydrogenase
LVSVEHRRRCGLALLWRRSGGSRFSPLTQINRENVHKLKVASIYHTGDVSDGSKHPRKSAFETTPILVDGTLYFSTAFNRVIALDPETGAERWSYDPKIDLDRGYSEGLINRGVSSWTDSQPRSRYRRRIFIAMIDARLICLDAAAGKPCTDFGNSRQIDLRQGIKNIIREGEYEETSPHDLVIVGSSVADNDRVECPSGVGGMNWSGYAFHPGIRKYSGSRFRSEQRRDGARDRFGPITTLRNNS